MSIASTLIADRVDEIPAVSHVDNTARVQTVTKSANRKFYDLIVRLHEISGTPVVLNTSFNLRGEAIVCTPQDALECFLRSELDVLVSRRGNNCTKSSE